MRAFGPPHDAMVGVGMMKIGAKCSRRCVGAFGGKKIIPCSIRWFDTKKGKGFCHTSSSIISVIGCLPSQISSSKYISGNLLYNSASTFKGEVKWTRLLDLLCSTKGKSPRNGLALPCHSPTSNYIDL
jgi:hypothetical protein